MFCSIASLYLDTIQSISTDLIVVEVRFSVKAMERTPTVR
jgi:hypothetical protein